MLKIFTKQNLEDLSPETQKKQQVRLQRFSLAILTYVLVALAAIIITHLGLGEMTMLQWSIFIGFGFIGNSFFFYLLYTNKNLNFVDPSLTQEQIIFSAFWGLMPLSLMPEARPIILMFYLPAFSFGILRLSRAQYYRVLAFVMFLYTLLLFFEYIEDRKGFVIQYEIFLFFLFGIVLSWFAFFGGFVSNLRRRLREQHENIQRAHEEIKVEVLERKQAQIEKDGLIVELKEALRKVKTLSGFLPICASCKKIRDDKGYWNQIESYIRDHSEVDFSHSICPDCAKKYYPEIHNRRKSKSDSDSEYFKEQ